MMKHDALVAALIARQRDLDESDLLFAQRLGISRQTWQFIRTGVRVPGLRTVRGIRQAFPELSSETDAFLSVENCYSSNSVTTAQEQTA